MYLNSSSGCSFVYLTINQFFVMHAMCMQCSILIWSTNGPRESAFYPKAVTRGTLTSERTPGCKKGNAFCFSGRPQDHFKSDTCSLWNRFRAPL